MGVEVARRSRSMMHWRRYWLDDEEVGAVPGNCIRDSYKAALNAAF